ncbi:MAG: flavodoxin family protein [[Clostridium] scindens]
MEWETCACEYYKAIENNASAPGSETDNDYLGSFICQGKMPQKVRQKYESMKNNQNAGQMDMYIHEVFRRGNHAIPTAWM